LSSSPVRHLVPIVLLTCLCLERPARADDRCENGTLQEVFNIIHAACTEESCDPERLKEISTHIERWKLMTAMKTLFTVHVFFPIGKSDMQSALDLRTGKSDQLALLRSEIRNPEDTIVYVVGRGSAEGSSRINWEISRKRTLAVYRYLEDNLKLNCRFIQKVALGKTILQLSLSDAKLLDIADGDYRSDVNVLNQSVEIFVYPCRNRLREVKSAH
jgi:hypothetical protein